MANLPNLKSNNPKLNYVGDPLFMLAVIVP